MLGSTRKNRMVADPLGFAHRVTTSANRVLGRASPARLSEPVAEAGEASAELDMEIRKQDVCTGCGRATKRFHPILHLPLCLGCQQKDRHKY